MSVRRLCEEEATEEKAEAAGAELKTKTPHNDVGKNKRLAKSYILTSRKSACLSRLLFNGGVAHVYHQARTYPK